MRELLFVGLGGALGAIARYLVGSLVRERAAGVFPWSTLAVNLIGCAAIGVLMGFVEERGAFGPRGRLLLFTGLLGSFTTFSTFAWDGFDLGRGGEAGALALYVGASVVGGLALAWAARASTGALLGG